MCICVYAFVRACACVCMLVCLCVRVRCAEHLTGTSAMNGPYISADSLLSLVQEARSLPFYTVPSQAVTFSSDSTVRTRLSCHSQAWRLARWQVHE